jgi:hypothetical protein
MGNGSTSVHAVAVAVAAAELGRGEWSFGRPVADAIVVVLFRYCSQHSLYLSDSTRSLFVSVHVECVDHALPPW